MNKPKLKLVGEDGNAFAISPKAKKVVKKNGLNWEEIAAEAMSGHYDNLLHTMQKHFDVS